MPPLQKEAPKESMIKMVGKYVLISHSYGKDELSLGNLECILTGRFYYCKETWKSMFTKLFFLKSGNLFLGNICRTTSLQMLLPTYQAWNQNREDGLDCSHQVVINEDKWMPLECAHQEETVIMYNSLF